nr:methyltransferase domain-containing protein [Parahaliea mediterranea]
MAAFPLARRQEFELAVARLDLQPGCDLCDVPAGGGYLADYLPRDDLFLLCLETASEFASQCPRNTDQRVLETALESLPLGAGSVDRILSLAAMHHVDDKHGLLKEFSRILRGDGQVVVADVEAGTRTAAFLNEFVDRFNSMGHKGHFIDAAFIDDVDQCGLSLKAVDRPPLTWSFASRANLIDFCRHLFGLDRAADQDIIGGAEEYLGLREDAQGVSFDWQLVYITAAKD